MLTYYAIANACVWTLPPEPRRWPKALAVVSALGCVVLAITLPTASVVTGAAVLAAGAAIWFARRALAGAGSP